MILVAAGHSIETLADIPTRVGGILFVGLNPAPVSVAAGHYHQGKLGRRFWARLVEAGVLPAQTKWESADDALERAGHGITDLIKTPTPRDKAPRAVLEAGIPDLNAKVEAWRPGAVVFIYKRAAEIVSRRKLGEAYGRVRSTEIAGVPCYLVPAPFAARTVVNEGLQSLRKLAERLREIPQ